MKEQLKELKVKNFIFILIAGIINAFGVTLFLFPVKLYDSGISGVSMLLDQVTPPYLVLSMFLMNQSRTLVYLFASKALFFFLNFLE